MKKRLAIATLAWPILLAAAPAAHAQWSFSVTRYDEANSSAISDLDWPYYIDQARCLCDEARGDEQEAFVWFRLKMESGATGGGEEVLLYVGNDCANDAIVIDEQCFFLGGTQIASFENNDPAFAIPVHRIVDPAGGVCTETNAGTSNVYVFVGDTTAEPSSTLELPYDTRSPDPPASLSGAGGEGAVTLSWDAPADDSGIASYDILCSEGGFPGPGASPSNASFDSTEDLCDKTLSVGDATSVGAAESCASLTSGLTEGGRARDCYVCASVSASSNTYRMDGLTNGTSYQFGVVAVDDSGNVSPISPVISATPMETTDFAENYGNAGGKERGGFCFIATAVYGDYGHPEVVRLRHFRDTVLARSGAGRGFVRWYYGHGRTLAALKSMSPIFAALSRLGLEGLGWLADRTTNAPPDPSGPAGLPMGLLLLGLVWAAARRRTAPGGDRPADSHDPGTEPEVHA